MASITIRNMEDRLKAKLPVRAAHHGRSMEDEARDIIRTVLAEKKRRPDNIAEAIQRRFVALGGVDPQLPERELIPEPPRFDE